MKIKIGLKLTAIMVILSLFGIITVGAVLLSRSRAIITDLANKYTLSLAEGSAGEVKAYLEDYWETAETIAETMSQYYSILPEERRSMFNVILEGLTRSHAEIIGMWCVWERDTLEGNDQLYLGTRGTNSRGRFSPYYYWDSGSVKLQALENFEQSGPGDYYLLPRSNNTTMILPPYESMVQGSSKLITTVAAPIRNNGVLVGVVGINITLDEVQNISQSAKPYPDAITAVFANNGTVAGHFDTSRIGKNGRDTEEDINGPFNNEFIRSIRDGRYYRFERYVPSLRAQVAIQVIPIIIGTSTAPWSFAVGTMTSTVMAPVNTMMYITFVIVAAMIAIITLVAIILSRSLSRPIVRATNTLKDISKGEGDLTKHLEVASKDEIGDLAMFFNETLDNIRNLVGVIKYKIHALTNTGHELTVNMSKTTAAVDNIAANFEEIKTLDAKQQEGSAEVNKALEKIKTSITQQNELIDEQTERVNTSSTAIEEMTANIHSVSQTLVENSKKNRLK